MNKDASISVDFAGTRLQNPVMLASGTCGYGDELADFLDINALGGFVTKSISLKPRKGNPVPRIVETNAGMLNAIGLANVGSERFLQEKIPILQDMARAGVLIVFGLLVWGGRVRSCGGSYSRLQACGPGRRVESVAVREDRRSNRGR